MLYRILKWLFIPAVKGYFRSLKVEGRSYVPDTGPIIFVVNHNSAFMDPIVLGVHIRQPVYFLARAESFKKGLLTRIFNALNMIPVYRPEITPDKVHMNKQVFEKCYDHLKKGRSIMIFPEGFSETVRYLRPLKTGAARIALGAEEMFDFKLGLKIIPVGINYSNPHRFRSDVLINFGSPLEITSFRAELERNEKEAVTHLTTEISQKMGQLLVNDEDESKLEEPPFRRSKISFGLIRKTVLLILGAPLFIYGLLVNILPYAIVALLSARIRVREDFVGSKKLALGAFGFLIFYILQIVMFGLFFKWYWTLLFAVSLYPSGVFSLNYMDYLSTQRNR